MNSTLTTPDSSTPVSAMMLALSPFMLERPMKNCLPYWMPMAYRNIARPSVPTMGEGADFGANQPMASATKSTAPTPRKIP